MAQGRARFLSLAVERKVRRRLGTERNRMFVRGRHHVHPHAGVQALAQALGWQVDFIRRQHRTLDVVGALVVTFGGLGPEGVGGVEHALAKDEERVVGEVVEERFGFREEQRQVVLDAARRDTFLHVLVERATAHVDRKPLAQRVAEMLRRFIGERELTAGQQFDALHLVLGTLRFRVETSDGIDLVVEQLHAIGLNRAHGEDVDQCAAYREIARLRYLRHVPIAGRLQAALLGLQVEFLPLVEDQAGSGDMRARRQSLHQRTHRHHQHSALHRRQLVERGDALGNDLRMRTEDVVGERFPIREVQHRQAAGKDLQFVFKRVCPLRVPGNHHQQALVVAGSLGHVQCPG